MKATSGLKIKNKRNSLCSSESKWVLVSRLWFGVSGAALWRKLAISVSIWRGWNCFANKKRRRGAGREEGRWDFHPERAACILSNTQHRPQRQRCPPASCIPTLINCTKDLGAFRSALCHLLCSAPRYRWQCRMELAHPLAAITAPRCNLACSLSQGRGWGFLQICLKSVGFLPSYLMTIQLSPPEFTVTPLSHHRQKQEGSKATAASKRARRCSKSASKFGHDVATWE